MTLKTQATQIVQKHYEIIESHLSTYPITDDHKMEMAKEHAAQEVRGTLNLQNQKEGKWLPATVPDSITFWTSVLTEIEKTK